jgi:hypothetical protein
MFYRVITESEPSRFNINIWAVYVTAYARIRITDLIRKHNALYCDTDSLITTDEINDSKELGELKLEHRINKGFIVRPKFYGFRDTENKDNVRIKGVNVKFVFDDFSNLITNSHIVKNKVLTQKIHSNKFTKLRESLRRGNFQINEVQKIFKELELNDKKRLWKHNFNINKLQESEAITI